MNSEMVQPAHSGRCRKQTFYGGRISPTPPGNLAGEGTDFKYGARQLKLLSSACLVQPLSNLMPAARFAAVMHRVSHEHGSAGLLFGP